MRRYIVAIVLISLALAACSSNPEGGAADGAPADSAMTSDGRPADTAMTSDGADGAHADDGGITCAAGGACYSSDCARIVSCSDVALCPAGQLDWSRCFGPDAGRDGGADR